MKSDTPEALDPDQYPNSNCESSLSATIRHHQNVCSQVLVSEGPLDWRSGHRAARRLRPRTKRIQVFWEVTNTKETL